MWTDTEPSSRPLFDAIRRGDAAVVREQVELLDNICEDIVVVTDYHYAYWSPIELACMNKTPEMLLLLLELRPVLEPNALDYALDVVFQWQPKPSDRNWAQVLDDAVPVCEVLVDNGVDINQRLSDLEITPLSSAVLYGAERMVEFLLEHGAVLGHTCDGNCPDCYTVTQGQLGAMRLLIEHGLEPCFTCEDTPGFVTGMCEASHALATTYYQWSPARHYRAPPAMKDTVRTAMALHTISPTLCTMPPEIMFLVFELIPYC